MEKQIIKKLMSVIVILVLTQLPVSAEQSLPPLHHTTEHSYTLQMRFLLEKCSLADPSRVVQYQAARLAANDMMEISLVEKGITNCKVVDDVIERSQILLDAAFTENACVFQGRDLGPSSCGVDDLNGLFFMYRNVPLQNLCVEMGREIANGLPSLVNGLVEIFKEKARKKGETFVKPECYDGDESKSIQIDRELTDAKAVELGLVTESKSSLDKLLENLENRSDAGDIISLPNSQGESELDL